MIAENEKKAIIEYYEKNEYDYRLLWDLDRSMALHMGFWDEKTKNFPHSLRRENEWLAERAKIIKTDRVLDAGCGVGGSSVYLAKNIGCQVTGITLSERQKELATENAQKNHCEQLANFLVMDYTHTIFPSESFDVVWAIESVCHAQDKRDFVNEAFRLLKKGGRLILADGFMSEKDSFTNEEMEITKKWLNGWGVNELEKPSIFQNYCKEAGFSEVHYQSAKDLIMPSALRLYYYSFPVFVCSKIGQLLGLRTQKQTDNVKSAYYQYIGLKRDLWTYGIVFAVK